MLSGFLLRWACNAVAIAVATKVVPGLRVPDAGGVLLAALVLGVVNASIRWVFLILTLPLTILTLGLFTLVVNALMLSLVAALTPLEIDSFWAAFLGALLIAVVSTALSHLVGR
jgi:putative membrane protein